MNNRRFFLKNFSLLTLTGFTSSHLLEAANTCKNKLTPKQSLGPFYPEKFKLEKDADLTQLRGHKQKAKGRLVHISGNVQDEFCKPIVNAIVEVWQACYSGRYNHPSDTSEEALDPHFQYYAMMKTDSKGKYSFKTIVPGAYKASPNWMRPPHIHYKVSLRGYQSLVTQLYFSGEKFNREDGILNSLTLEERKKVIVDFKKDNKGLLKGNFNIFLKKHSL